MGIPKGADVPTGGAPPGPIRRAIEAAGATALGLLIFVFSYAPLRDEDLWWHLKAGWLIASRHAVPRTNTFLYSAPDTPWIDIHWPFQVIAWEAWRSFGPGGIVWLKVSLCLATWAILSRIATPPGRFLGMLPFLAIGAVASNERMSDRPELFSFLFLVLVIALLLRWRRRPGWGPLAGLLAVQVLWANFHALSVIGPGVIGAFLAGETARRLLWSRRGGPDLAKCPLPAGGPGAATPPGLRDLLRLAMTGVLCLAALAATPYGLEGARYPIELFLLLRDRTIAIAEFMSPFPLVRVVFEPSFHLDVAPVFYPTAAIHAFWILGGAVALVILLSLPRVDLSLLLTTLALFGLAASGRRNIPLFVIGSLPFLGAQMNVLAKRLPVPVAVRRIGGYAVGLATIGMIVMLARDAASGRFYARDGLSKGFGSGVDEGLIPREAMDYVLERGLSGNAFNDIDSGGYFTWRAFPERRAFIDARLKAVPHALVDEYALAFYTDAGWARLMARYRFDYAVLNHRREVNLRLIRRLAADPAWAIVHLDSVGLVAVRRASAATALLARDEIGTGRNPPPPFPPLPHPDDPVSGALRRALGASPPPETADALAYATILIHLGFASDAAGSVDAALAADPRSARAWILRGSIADTSGDLSRAREAFEEAARLDPGSMEAAFNLGFARLRSGEFAGAMSDLERAIRLRPTFAQAHAMLGVARLAAGNAAGAEAPLRRAIALDPALADPVYYLGVMARQRGDLAAATGLFADFLKRPGGNPALRADAERTLRNAR